MTGSDLQFQAKSIYTDFSALKGLGAGARSGDPAAVKEVAKQFEAIFLQMMLAGMRKTINTDDEFSNEKNMYYDMFDKQVALDLSGKGGIGLADMMLRQLGLTPDNNKINTTGSQLLPPRVNIANEKPVNARNNTVDNAIQNKSVTKNTDISHTNITRSQNINPVEVNFKDPIDFVKKIWDAGKKFIIESGLDPKVVIAQAALETGWGKFMIKGKSGNSHNLFGIKAGKDWVGDKVVTNTIEYKNGTVQRIKAGFRSYKSIEDSVKDYVQFLKSDSRYNQAIRQADNPAMYAYELQKAGYATDPNYADKILRIMNGKTFADFFKSDEI